MCCITITSPDGTPDYFSLIIERFLSGAGGIFWPSQPQFWSIFGSYNTPPLPRILESPSLGEPRTGLVACIALEEVAKPPPGVLKADDGKPEQNQRKEDMEGGSWGSGRTTPQFRTTRQLPHSVANLLGETLVQQKAGLPHHG